MADIWIINGLPGAEKSTTAHALAARFDRSAHVEGDRMQECIVAGAVPPGGSPPQQEAYQIHLSVRNQCLLARSFADAGFIPVIDYIVVSRERVVEYRQQLGECTLYLVTLVPGIAVTLERDRLRPEKTVGDVWVHLHEMIQAELSGVGLWVDNSTLPVEEIVDYLLANKEAARV
jgi:hypothetical protein